MAVLGAVIQTFVPPMLDTRDDFPLGCTTGTKLVGDKAFGTELCRFIDL